MYKVVTVGSPPLQVTKGCALQRIRERDREEAFRVDDMRERANGSLLGDVLEYL